MVSWDGCRGVWEMKTRVVLLVLLLMAIGIVEVPARVRAGERRQREDRPTKQRGGKKFRYTEVFDRFLQWDTDQNLILSPQELPAAVRRGRAPKLSQLDLNGDGSITLLEVQKSLQEKMKRRADQAEANLRRHLTEQTSQPVPLDRLAQEYQNLLPTPDFLRRFDLNHDLVIDPQEAREFFPFLKALLFADRVVRLSKLIDRKVSEQTNDRARFFAMVMDTNHDNIIQRSEFETLIQTCISADLFDYYSGKFPLPPPPESLSQALPSTISPASVKPTAPAKPAAPAILNPPVEPVSAQTPPARPVAPPVALPAKPAPATAPRVVRGPDTYIVPELMKPSIGPGEEDPLRQFVGGDVDEELLW